LRSGQFIDEEGDGIIGLLDDKMLEKVFKEIIDMLFG
jgi:hypothetical protein